MKGYSTAVFDMDGTILDTLEDLTISMNYAMKEAGHRCDYKKNQVRMFFGSGVKTAVCRALACERGISGDALEDIQTPEQVPCGEGTGEEPGKSTADEVRKISSIYVPYYDEHCDDHAGAYKGISRLLESLKAQGIKTAVVSNKPDAAVQKLVNEKFPGLFSFAAGEQESRGISKKPAPDMVFSSLKALDSTADESVYIGDSEIDILTARNAGMPCISVDWGFRTVKFLESHGASCIVSSVEELFERITGKHLK